MTVIEREEKRRLTKIKELTYFQRRENASLIVYMPIRESNRSCVRRIPDGI